MSSEFPASTDHVESSSARAPIAMIGMSCRFAGASSLQSFWELLRSGSDALAGTPPQRAVDLHGRVDRYHEACGRKPSARGGFLPQIDRFDAGFFGISPREAKAIDPQQRLLLETAWEALEDAGLDLKPLAGSRTGVFVGMWTADYEDHLFRSTRDVDIYTTTGSGRYAASGRISFAFDFRGPSLTVDTACSSSLVAVHLACQSLRSGECGLALVGGANLILRPEINIGYAKAGVLSPDGRCKFADWSLLTALNADAATSRLNQTAVAQPLIFALQVALAELLMSWGVEPAAVVGHSMGEVAAAHIAGVLTLADAVAVIYHRGRIMQQASGGGSMAAVELSESEARAAVAPRSESGAEFHLFSRRPCPPAENVPWREHACGRIAREPLGAPLPATMSLDLIGARCHKRVPAAEHYQAMRVKGLQYGPCFQGVETLLVGEGEAVVRLRQPETMATDGGAYAIPPAALDACFQALIALGQQTVPAAARRLAVRERFRTATGPNRE